MLNTMKTMQHPVTNLHKTKENVILPPDELKAYGYQAKKACPPIMGNGDLPLLKTTHRPGVPGIAAWTIRQSQSVNAS